MHVAYRLAAGTDDFHNKLRRELIIHVDPSMNPDGRERYLSQLEQLSGKVMNFRSSVHAALRGFGRPVGEIIGSVRSETRLVVHDPSRVLVLVLLYITQIVMVSLQAIQRGREEWVTIITISLRTGEAVTTNALPRRTGHVHC